MTGLALNVLPCSRWIQCDRASKKWSMSIVLGRSGPKLRLPEKFLNYSALIITVWTLLLKELSLPSLLPCPLANLNHGILTLLSCANKTTKITVSIHKRMPSVREHAREGQTLRKGTVIVGFLEVAKGIFHNVTYFTNKFFFLFFQNRFYTFLEVSVNISQGLPAGFHRLLTAHSWEEEEDGQGHTYMRSCHDHIY